MAARRLVYAIRMLRASRSTRPSRQASLWLFPQGTARPTAHWAYRLARPVLNVEKIWLLLAGLDGPEFRETTDSATVANFVVGREGGEARAFELRHQRQVFSIRKDANSELQRIKSVPVILIDTFDSAVGTENRPSI